MRNYSSYALIKNALTGNTRWTPAWRNARPRKNYEVIIIGGGGHGLATAYYLAKNHGITDVAVLDKGWIGGGNTGRNTTIIRSDYLLEENAGLYDFSLGLWAGLSRELNFNLMFSERGAVTLAHSEAHLNQLARLANAMLLRGVNAELLTREEVLKEIPVLDGGAGTRWPVEGAFRQPEAGTARHDAVVWGYARAADSLGVDIVEQCEVVGMNMEKGRIKGVQTSQGVIAADKVAIVVAGHTSTVAALAGLTLPVESHLLQAMVSEPIKPVLDTVVMSMAYDGYVSQTNKGEIVMGAELDGYPSYSQRGNLPRIEDCVRYTLTMFPSFSGLRLMRSWAGINDMTMDGSPLIGPTPVDGLYINGGWCYGGFKTIPGSGWAFADTLAHDRAHRLVEPYRLDRFNTGHTINENGHGPLPQHH
jgi:sarcosine oxidase subunit beta